MKDLKNLFKNFDWLKNSKKNTLIIVGGIIIIALIFISEINVDTNNDKKPITHTDDNTTANYCEYLEEKVCEIVKSIDGAGEARVMITLSETTEYVYATNDKDVRKSNEDNDDTAYENDYVIIEKDSNDTGLLIKTIEPKVRGVAVVCDGGDNIKVQNQIYSAVGAVLNVSTSRISISKLTNTEDKNEK